MSLNFVPVRLVGQWLPPSRLFNATVLGLEGILVSFCLLVSQYKERVSWHLSSLLVVCICFQLISKPTLSKPFVVGELGFHN